jgi:phytanoyl-CoA hydroxylase
MPIRAARGYHSQMRDCVTAGEVSAYQRDGFLILEGFLAGAEVDRWRSAVEGAVTARENDPSLEPSINQERWPAAYGFRQFMNLWETDATMRELLLDPRVGRIASQLTGSGEIRVWYDQSFIKRPWAFPTPMHQDNPWWSFHDERAVTLWLTLDDVAETNGALLYLPGSHRVHNWAQVGGDGLGDIFGCRPEWRDIKPVCCPVPAGTAIWHNGLTVHGSGANMSHTQRRALNLALMPCPAIFNGIQNIFPDDMFATLRPGEPLVNDAINPRIYP